MRYCNIYYQYEIIIFKVLNYLINRYKYVDPQSYKLIFLDLYEKFLIDYFRKEEVSISLEYLYLKIYGT